MDEDFLRIYSDELDYLRRMSGEFAREFPTVARRLDLDEFECQDPWVERLIEGTAFLTARVQRELHGGMPRLAQSLIDIAAPHAAAPIPSMAICALQTAADMSGVKVIPAGTMMQSDVPEGARTPCTWRSIRDVTLRPVSIADVTLTSRGQPPSGISLAIDEQAWLNITLDVRGDRSTIGDGTPLSVHVMGPASTPGQLLRLLLGSCSRVVITDGEHVLQEMAASSLLDDLDLEQGNRELLTPSQRRGMTMLLMQRYAVLKEQFHGFGVEGISAAAMPQGSGTLQVVLMLNEADEELERRMRVEMFRLHTIPVVNLFKRRADRVLLDSLHEAREVVVDRTRPLDYEVYDLSSVEAIDDQGDVAMGLRPIYDLRDSDAQESGFYNLHRRDRLDSDSVRRHGARSAYRGTDTWISITLPRGRVSNTIEQLSVEVWCTNRDLPLLLPSQARCMPVESMPGLTSAHIVAGPSSPRRPEQHADRQWRVLGQMAVGHLRAVDHQGEQHATGAFRDALMAHIDDDDQTAMQQIRAIHRITGRTITRRRLIGRRAAEVRGLECTMEVSDEALHGGVDVYTLPMVVARFLRRLISVNAFIETKLIDSNGKVLLSWQARTGHKSML
jgi:type VI secretion system protein ImpG